MYETELKAYCQKHNLEVVEQYSTIGDERGWHTRAIARDITTGQKYHLYYDRTYRRRSFAQQKRDYATAMAGGITVQPPKQRGWRNTTIDNQRRKARLSVR